MVEITFVQPDGTSKTVSAKTGDNVMQTARNASIPGIVGECGGAMMCATCHCYVDDEWAGEATTRNDGEEDMLDCGEAEVKDTSRLTCQLIVSDALDGLVLHVPEV